MAIQVGGTTVIDNSRTLQNVGGLKTVNGTSILGSGNISAGASTTYGDVGTYVGGYVNSGVSVFVDNNTNMAGSSILVYSGSSAQGHSLNSGNQHSAGTKSAGLSGTWKCMSSYENNSTTYLWGAIWMRIS